MKFVRIICLIGILLLFNLPIVHAESTLSFSLTPPSTSVEPNKNISIPVTITASENTNLSVFRMKINFDGTILTYKGIQNLNPQIESNEIKTNYDKDNLVLIYVTNNTGINLNANTKTPLFELKFHVDAEAELGDTPIEVSLDGVGNYDAQEIYTAETPPIFINIALAPEADCSLRCLEVIDAILNPPFDPEILEYYVDVPSNRSTIEFHTETSDPTATTKISRKTLNKAGTLTNVNITVTSKDKKTKRIYKVTVDRAEKEESENSKSENSSTTSKNTTSSSKKPTNNSNITSSTENTETSTSLENSSNSPATQNAQRTIVMKENSFNTTLFYLVVVASIISLIIFYKYKEFFQK